MMRKILLTKIIPRIALRKAKWSKDKHLDDIVIADVDSVHLEDMGHGWWLGVYLLNGDRITFWIGKSPNIKVRVQEEPEHKYQDWDKWHKKTYPKSYKQSK